MRAAFSPCSASQLFGIDHVHVLVSPTQEHRDLRHERSGVEPLLSYAALREGAPARSIETRACFIRRLCGVWVC
ncbi:hypothetical protein EMEDMD4_10074 [Sinorhizobium medicae]|uniref:Uncharacterized protein n=1 Tax=Sinorhizobium medicae TaxID=110321 RepID=A0A508WMV7_9HYPH|nr:hypothetical protein EMEDMD4_10074 [Sinorhizobium medicae]